MKEKIYGTMVGALAGFAIKHAESERERNELLSMIQNRIIEDLTELENAEPNKVIKRKGRKVLAKSVIIDGFHTNTIGKKVVEYRYKNKKSEDYKTGYIYSEDLVF